MTAYPDHEAVDAIEDRLHATEYRLDRTTHHPDHITIEIASVHDLDKLRRAAWAAVRNRDRVTITDEDEHGAVVDVEAAS